MDGASHGRNVRPSASTCSVIWCAAVRSSAFNHMQTMNTCWPGRRGWRCHDSSSRRRWPSLRHRWPQGQPPCGPAKARCAQHLRADTNQRRAIGMARATSASSPAARPPPPCQPAPPRWSKRRRRMLGIWSSRLCSVAALPAAHIRSRRLNPSTSVSSTSSWPVTRMGGSPSSSRSPERSRTRWL